MASHLTQPMSVHVRRVISPLQKDWWKWRPRHMASFSCQWYPYWYGKCTIAMWPPCPFRWNDIDKVNAQLQNVVITSVQILVIRPEFEIKGLRHGNWTEQLYQNHLIYTTNTKFVVFIPMIYMNHTIKWYLGFYKDVVPSDTYEVQVITIIICYLH